MEQDFAKDVAVISEFKSVPIILDIVCRTTGMGFAAIARVTEDRWVACSVKDDIDFGLKPGQELTIETTICSEIRQCGASVVIDHVAEDEIYRNHHTPALYGFQSYISVPIKLNDGSFFGTLCAIDPNPHRLKTEETISMFEMFAETIGQHITTINRLGAAEEILSDERNVSALREQFIAVLAHDLRNPLSAIVTGLDVLEQTPLTETGIQTVQLLRRSSTRMGDLIEDVMDFARGRLGGGIDVDRSGPVDLEPLLQHVVAELHSQRPEREIICTYNLPKPVNCDARRISQLASNLLGNALNYGSLDKPIEFTAEIKKDWFELCVSNGGEPIPQVVLDHLFEPFYRGEVRPSLQGLGLGLYISHNIALAHQGTLEAVSNADRTCLTFRMPA